MAFWLRRSSTLLLCAGIVFVGLDSRVAHTQTPPATGVPAITKAAGTIKSAQSDSIVLTPDSGGEISASLSAATKILRVPAGEKDLKNAVPLAPADLQPGDRVLVRGTAANDGHTITALAVIVMKQADFSAKQQHERDDWQKRGVGGLVTAVDAAAGSIVISTAAAGGNHSVVIHTTPSATARRYAPDSVKFDDARPAPLHQIKAGDQLRARGTRNADGSELAEEIVFGTFRNIAGTISSIDAASNAMTVQDVIGKASVIVKISPGSQIKKLPPEMAQRIAMRLKGGSGQPPQGAPQPAAGQAEGASGGRPQYPRGPGEGGQPATGAPDLQRFLGRIPDSTLGDLSKGDAVMIVSTLGEVSGTVTAITVLAGVEPILTASPNRSAMTLSPWNLGGGGGEGESPR